MNYKYLAAAAYLCITFITLSASITAEQTVSPGAGQHYPTELFSRTGNATQATRLTNNQAPLNLLDTVWIFGFTVAGLILLRKVQGD
jgi:hypothetical protein